ncbi:MAG: 4-hydroxy-tetrahydrodipicolinate synthase [Candidatus Levybacteria bacterium]|nr:4-hydroxy-tetrahydrodipicolinate synthase [Candidatus Levybacteria bacterium]
MLKKFEGVFVPNITPFTNGEVDEEGLRRVVRYLIDNGVDGLVPNGTTGESATLTDDEKKRILKIVLEEAKGKVPVIAGTGTNDTRHTIELTQQAEELGADAVLVVTPYYNKPTQQGLLEHFKKVASSTSLPVILYNIPGRTSRNIDTPTVIELSKVKNIVGVKEASGDINQMMDTIKGTKNFSVLCGEDHLLFTMSCLGGNGAIAAAGHILPNKFKEMHNLVKAGKIEKARELHYFLLPMIRALFAETNPSPIKGAYELLGICSKETRLPLVPATEKLMGILKSELKRLGLKRA